MHSSKTSRRSEILAALKEGSKKVSSGIEEEISCLQDLSNAKRLLEVIPFLCFYISGAALAYNQSNLPLLLFPGIVLMGVALNSLGILVHEGLHGALVKGHRLNHLLSFLAGVPLLISTTAYQVTHANHHFELGRKLDYGTYKQHLNKSFQIWIAYFAQLFLGAFLYTVFIPLLAFKSATKRSRIFISIEYVAIVGLLTFAVTKTSTNAILLFWAYPLLIANILTNIRGLASHALVDVESPYLSSRTIKSSKLVSFLFLHENYHLEHHIFPSIPSYNLRKAHLLIWNRLPKAVYSDSYSTFLINFFKAAIKNDLSPMGIVRPGNESPKHEIITSNV